MASRIPTDDSGEVTLDAFEQAAEKVLGPYATKILIKLLQDKYGIRFTETSGPALCKLRLVLDRLIGDLSTTLILGKPKQRDQRERSDAT